MPRYFFHVYHEQPEIDQEGEELPDKHAAWKEATVMAGEILKDLDGKLQPKPWLRSPFNERSPRFSPDGRWIAYQSDESGNPEVYVALTEGAGEKRRISPSGGRSPRWRRDGKELYYAASDESIVSVPITLGPSLQVGTGVPLFRVETGIRNFDVSPDGTRFLVSTPVEKSPESPIRVILNWEAAVRKPAG